MGKQRGIVSTGAVLTDAGLLGLVSRDTPSSPWISTSIFEICRADGKKRNDVTDFVWCLENRINAGSHNSGFPRGPDAPSRVSEGASEPSDWNADDIRAVWWKNVT